MNWRKDINEHMNEDSDHRTNYSITDRIAAIIKNRKHSKARRIVATTLAGVVAFTTTYSLILPAISVELETADQVGMVLHEEGLIDEAETQENALYPEASSFEGTGEGPDTLDGDLSSYEEPAADNPDNEGLVDGEASADIVGEEIITQTDGNDQMMSQAEYDDTDLSGNPASVEDGDLGADGLDSVLTLTASAENVNLILTYPQEIPAGSSATFNPVDSVYYDNYYYSAKDVLEENYDGWEVSEGQFWNVITVPGSGVEVELDYNELLGASDDSAGLRYVLMDWSNEEWHLYDSEQTVVELNEEGNLGRVIFRTDALQNGAAVFGVLSLEERHETETGNTEDETTEDGTPVAGDIEAGNAEGGVTENGDIEAENAAAGISEGGDTEAEYAQDAQVNDTDATVAAAGTDTMTVEETEDADEAEDAEAEQTEETAASGDGQSDGTTGSETAEGGEVQDGETAAGEEEQNAENAEGEPEQNVEAAAGEEKQDVEAAEGEEEQDVEEAEGEEEQDGEAAEGDSEPAEGPSVSAQNETEDQPQTAGETETTDAENAAEAADPENADGKADAENTDEEADYPSQLFSSTGDVSVYVTAPVGAFPADTTMIVTPVEEEADIENITETISDSSVSRIQAVDIAFFNKEGKEIEPRVPIRVRLVADRMKSDEDAVIVHVDDNGSVEEVRDASITVSGSQAHITMKAGEETAVSENGNLGETDTETADNAEAADEADSEEVTGETHSDVETDRIENPQENISTDLSGSENSDESVTGGAESQEDILNEGVTTETAFTENDAQGANVLEANTQGADSQEANVQSSDAQGTNAAEENGQPGLGEDNSSDSLTAEFVADEFSIYAVVYTVDFTYEGRTWSFPGQGSYRLSDVLAVLGIEGNVDEAALTLIMGEDHAGALYLTQADGEYYINSDIAFTDTYELRVRSAERVYLISVTDTQTSADLSDFLKNAVITGATQDPNGSYHVEAGEEYSIILTFAEGSDYQFNNTGTLSYQIPEGIEILARQESDGNINIVYKGRTYQVSYHYVLGTDGLLQIDFDKNDPDFPRLEESTNVSFRFTYYGQFDGEITKIKFSDSIERDIIFDEPEPAQAYVSKSGTFDESTGTYHYTVKVTASGAVTDVRVKDVISGNALRFNNDVRVSGNSSKYTDNVGGNGFDYTFASMQEGEEITITYSANLDPSKIPANGKVTADMTRNTVTVTPDDGPPHNSSYSHEINLKKPDKSTGVESGTTADGKKLYKWTIDYNTLALAKAGGDTVSDSIGESSRQYMKYHGNVTVKVYDHSGNLVATRSFTPATDYRWTYIVPDAAPYRYVFEYETEVDQAAIDLTGSSVKLNNDSEGPGGKDSEDITIGPKESTSITKEVVSSNEQEVTWISHIHVPASGLSKAEVIDTLPSIWSGNLGLSGNYMLYDLYKAGSLEITGLDDQERYTVDATSRDKIAITFFKDSAKKEEGLNSSAGGRDITVKLTTTVNRDWLDAGYSYPTSYQSSHTNKIKINGGDNVQAEVKYIEPSIEKSGLSTGKGVYKYTIYVTHVDSSPIVVNDKFDTSLLEVDTSLDGQDWNYQSMFITGGDYPGHVYSGDTSVKVDYSDTADGIQITANNVPLQSNGQFYPTYMITYFLKLKEGVDLEQLAIANGGKYDLTNTAMWDGHEDSFTFTTTYDFLDKQLLNDGQLGKTSRKAQYQITFNSAKATLHGGEPMEMTDIISANLSVDYSSIHIVTDPEGQAVPYSLSGGKDEHGDPDGTTVATYSVPDSTKVVITYDADVRGNGSQTIVNKVSVNGEDETVTTTKSYGSSTEGEGAIASFKIVKVDGYDANKKLAGVKFRIFAENPNIDFGEGRKELILETDENGEIVLDGELYQIMFDETYHVQEVEPLEDYGTIGFDYLVTLTNKMAEVDYDHYVYYYSDSMQIKNWPLEGLVVEKQVESPYDSDKTQYYHFKVSILNEDGTAVNTDFNEKIGDDTFVKGVFEFDLKDNEQKMFWGFQKGTKYKVEEIDSKGLTTSVTYSVYDEDGSVTKVKTDPGNTHTGTLTQENEVIKFTNSKTEQKGALKLTKLVTVNSETTTSTVADGTYTFTVTDSGTPATVNKTVAITVTNGVAASATVDGQAVELDNGFVVISDLTPGVYTITETKPTNGTSISKINGTETTSYSTTVTVVADETIGAEATATFTNNLPTTEVIVNKQWKPTIPENTTITLGLYSGKTAEAAAATTPVTTIVLDGTADSTAENISSADTKAGTKQETAGWTAEFRNLPKYAYDTEGGVYEIKYVVKETNAPEGYTVSYGGDGAYVITGGTITNTKNPGDLELTKKVAGDGADTSKEFEFTIELTAPAGETLAESYTFKKGDAEATGITYTRNGTATETESANSTATVTGIKLKADETFTIVGLPAGTTYKITETDYSAAGYSSSIPSDGKTDTIRGGTTAKESVEVTNTLSAGDLTVEKTLGGNATDSNKEFNFKVIFEKAGLTGNNGTYKIGTLETIASVDATNITFTEGKAEISYKLKGGQKAVFSNLPDGTKFTVEEISKDADGYETTVSSIGGTVNADKTVTGLISSTAAVTVSYVNTKDTIPVEAAKAWKSGDTAIAWPEDVESVEFTLYKTVNSQTTVVDADDLKNYWVDTSTFTNPITISSSTEGKKASWADLPKRMLVTTTETADGQEVTTSAWYDVIYSVKETKVTFTAASGKETLKTEEAIQAAYNPTSWDATDKTITNTETKDFEFTKIWRDINQKDVEWPEGKQITVTFNASVEGKEKALEDQKLTFSPVTCPEGWTKEISADGNKTTFKISGLAAKDADGKELTYYVVEETVEGYNEPIYAFDTNGTITIKLDSDPTKDKAVNRDYIINTPEGGYELPQTGGPGTRLFTILGSILILGAGVLLWRRRKLI